MQSINISLNGSVSFSKVFNDVNSSDKNMDRQKAANGNLIFINNCCGCYKRVLLARQILLKNQGHRIIKYWIK